MKEVCNRCDGNGILTKVCRRCNGTKFVNGEICGLCRGTGKYLFIKNKKREQPVPCPTCGGGGTIDKRPEIKHPLLKKEHRRFQKRRVKQ